MQMPYKPSCPECGHCEGKHGPHGCATVGCFCLRGAEPVNTWWQGFWYGSGMASAGISLFYMLARIVGGY